MASAVVTSSTFTRPQVIGKQVIGKQVIGKEVIGKEMIGKQVITHQLISHQFTSDQAIMNRHHESGRHESGYQEFVHRNSVIINQIINIQATISEESAMEDSHRRVILLQSGPLRWLLWRGIWLWLVLLAPVAAWSADGLLSAPSPHTATVTLDRLEGQIRERGMKVFARIDHAEGAATVGLALGPTQVLLFGHPKGGTPLMQCAQSWGIDLPLKALAWTDASGQTHLAFNDPDYHARRHGAEDCAALVGLRKLLNALLVATTTP